MLMDRMHLIGLLLAATVVTLTYGQSKPQLTFHFVAPNTGRVPETQDVHMEEELDHLLYGLMCKSAGNRFTVRISPSASSTDVIDESTGLNNASDGAKNCMFPGPANPVKCDKENFCTMGNNCVASIMAVCPRHGTVSRWLMTQIVDVTLDAVEGEIVVVRCYTRCESDEKDEFHDHTDENGLSYLEIGFIIAGVFAGASLLVIGLVVWKIRDTKYLEHPDRHKHIHIHYVK